MLAEERLDLAVESSTLGPGEEVIVLTKSGSEVARGRVKEVFVDGGVWLESIDGPVKATRVYDPNLYSFIPLEPPEEDRSEPGEGPDVEPEGEFNMPTIAELEFDRRARERMEELGINLEAADDGGDDEEGKSARGKKKAGKKAGKKSASKSNPDDEGDDESDDDEFDDDEDDDEDDGDDDGDDDAVDENLEPPPKAGKKAGKKKAPRSKSKMDSNDDEADTASEVPTRNGNATGSAIIGGREGGGAVDTSVDIETLPKSVREVVSKFGDLDDTKADRVLSSISDAAVRALREAGIKDNEIYRYVVKMQDVISPVLGRKPAGRKDR